MLGPSPDWGVGVSRLNLCLPDCSWVRERSFDLYPWDAGTDSGVSYEVSESMVEFGCTICTEPQQSDKSP